MPIGTLPRTHARRVLLVGDAAAQVKPLSGGGIFTGMRCAEIAADVASQGLAKGDLSEGFLAEYDRRWRAELGEEFRRALYLRRLFTRLSDDELERVVRALKGTHLEATIVAFGDIDFPTHVARELLKASPGLVRLLPKALGAWVSAGPYRAPELDFGPRREVDEGAGADQNDRGPEDQRQRPVPVGRRNEDSGLRGHSRDTERLSD